MITTKLRLLALMFNKFVLTSAILTAASVCFCQEHQITRANLYVWDFRPKVQRYAHSGDFSEQVLILSDKVALIKNLAGTNKLSFTLAQVEWGGTPEIESISGYGIVNTKLLTVGIQRISMVSSNKLLLDIGPSREIRYALADLDKKTAIQSKDLKDFQLDKSVEELLWVPTSVYFDKQLVTFLKTHK